MPTLTTLALETLLEPTDKSSSKNPSYLKQNNDNNSDAKKEKKKPQANHIFITPALYTTPEPTPIPDSSTNSDSPSPYVVNHKRRDFLLPRNPINRVDGFDVQHQKSFAETEAENDESSAASLRQGKDDDFLSGDVCGDRTERFVPSPNGFFDPSKSVRVTSSCEEEDFEKVADNQRDLSSQGMEFYDADDDFSSDGSISNGASSHGPNIESELCAARIHLFEEIERRKSAEDALSEMHSQWQRIGNLLSQAGLTFPTLLHTSSSMQLEIDSIECFSQELVVARFVSEAIGKGEAHAESEKATETIIASKDQEISRLQDRVQYYEAVNHEMSHRNQEVMETARRQRQRKKSQRRWMIGISIAIGASIIAYSYFPQTSKHPLVISSDDCTASSTSSLESS